MHYFISAQVGTYYLLWIALSFCLSLHLRLLEHRVEEADRLGVRSAALGKRVATEGNQWLVVAVENRSETTEEHQKEREKARERERNSRRQTGFQINEAGMCS